MKKFNHKGLISAKLIFVLIAAVGVIVLLVMLARSSKFETVQINLSEGQQYREEQLRELGQLEEDTHVDGKLLLNQANLSKYSSCDYDFNVSDPKETVSYESKEKSIEFNLPFSDEWGSVEYTIMPYEDLQEPAEVYFGPLLEMADCKWQRAYSVELHETKPTAEILADLSMSNIDGELEFTKVKDREVIKYVEFNEKYSNCKSARMYLLGADYDYEFIVTCSEDLENDFGFLEQVLLTVKLK